MLFGRSVVATMTVVSGWLGFVTSVRLQGSHYDPYAYATGVGALFAAACAGIAFMMIRQRDRVEKIRSLERRIEELSDDYWELRENEERARSLLEAQGDVIVRRDASGLVTYANDAFCKLCGRDRDALVGSGFHPPLIEQGQGILLPDGTRGYDQKIETAEGVRWIAWREVIVRAGEQTQVQSVGRDVTDPASWP